MYYFLLRRAASASASAPNTAAIAAGSGSCAKATVRELPFQAKSAMAFMRFSAAKYSSASTDVDIPSKLPAVMSVIAGSPIKVSASSPEKSITIFSRVSLLNLPSTAIELGSPP